VRGAWCVVRDASESELERVCWVRGAALCRVAGVLTSCSS
jgi:hypothetical protein